MYGMDGSYLAFEVILTGLLFYLVAPWVGMGMPQARRPLQIAAGGGLLHATIGFLGAFLYRFEGVAKALTTGGNLLFWGGLAAAVYFVCLAAKGTEEVR